MAAILDSMDMEHFVTKENAIGQCCTKFFWNVYDSVSRTCITSIFFTCLRFICWWYFFCCCLLSDIALGPMDGKKTLILMYLDGWIFNVSYSNVSRWLDIGNLVIFYFNYYGKKTQIFLMISKHLSAPRSSGEEE